MKKTIILCVLASMSFGYYLINNPDDCYVEEQNYESAIKDYEYYQNNYNYKAAQEAKRKLERCYREKQLEHMRDVKRKLDQNW
ncbi:hypothetical protein IO382_000827 [Campylobacter lari]|uniref:hypothetical protein n=1 Tax=Campylobacter lari TaxID=201 RepID=UPI001273EE3C|nr:hypothetical protein [Campylobacter lari]EAK0446198.1 hypothetical protein [Campylobacter lari]EGK8058449.1 hypothetical protein [Campylobacter lari]MCR6565219.1 hypothetical protein [Campylobacter lari]